MAEEGACAMLIKQIHGELEKNANNSLRQNGLTMSQISVLMELEKASENQMELKQMERRLHVAQSTAAGIVQRLEQKGFVESFGSEEDKRIKIIRITQSGRECCREAETNMKQAETDLTSALTETEQAILMELLKKVRDSFQ